MVIKEVVKVNSRGMITIPSELRKKYKISDGTEIAVIEDEGRISIIPLRDIENLRGMFSPREKMAETLDTSYKEELELES